MMMDFSPEEASSFYQGCLKEGKLQSETVRPGEVLEHKKNKCLARRYHQEASSIRGVLGRESI